MHAEKNSSMLREGAGGNTDSRRKGLLLDHWKKRPTPFITCCHRGFGALSAKMESAASRNHGKEYERLIQTGTDLEDHRRNTVVKGRLYFLDGGDRCGIVRLSVANYKRSCYWAPVFGKLATGWPVGSWQRACHEAVCWRGSVAIQRPGQRGTAGITDHLQYRKKTAERVPAEKPSCLLVLGQGERKKETSSPGVVAGDEAARPY